MQSIHWTPVTGIDQIPPREGRAVRIGGKELAVFNLDGRFVTIENSCPHQGGPLCDGIVAGASVVCPLHGWHFDLNSGLAVRSSAPACVATFPTRVVDSIIQVDVGAPIRIDPEGQAA